MSIKLRPYFFLSLLFLPNKKTWKRFALLWKFSLLSIVPLLVWKKRNLRKSFHMPSANIEWLFLPIHWLHVDPQKLCASMEYSILRLTSQSLETAWLLSHFGTFLKRVFSLLEFNLNWIVFDLHDCMFVPSFTCDYFFIVAINHFFQVKIMMNDKQNFKF